MLDPLCSGGNFVESTTHFLLHRSHFFNQRLTLINKTKDIDKYISEKNDSIITQALLFPYEELSITDNKSISEVITQFSYLQQDSTYLFFVTKYFIMLNCGRVADGCDSGELT